MGFRVIPRFGLPPPQVNAVVQRLRGYHAQANSFIIIGVSQHIQHHPGAGTDVPEAISRSQYGSSQIDSDT
jgi:hypothetical protein